MRVTNKQAFEQILKELAGKTEQAQAPSIMMDNQSTAAAKQKQAHYQYELGGREGNTRIVGPESISVKIQYGFPHLNSDSISSSDGYVGDSSQGKRGDCYLLAEINAIRNTTHGQEILNKNLKWHGEDAVTVTLPGALKVRKEYERQGMPCEVTGTYYITKEALKKALAFAGQSYSKSEIEVIVLEIAMENYRAEMTATNELNHGKKPSFGTAEGSVNSHSSESNDFLSSGQMFDAGFILTGGQSEVYRAKKDKIDNVKPYMHGQYGFITREELERQTGADTTMYKAGVSEISNLSKEERALYNMLSKYEGRENEFALTCSVRVGKNGPDGHTQIGGGHALTVVKITQDTVYITNPWTPDKIEPIPREEFIKMCTGFDALDLSEAVPQETVSNPVSVLQSTIGKINGSHLTNNPQLISISPDKLRSLIAQYNRQHSTQMTTESLAQHISRVSGLEMNDEAKQKLASLISSLSSESKGIDSESLAFFNKYGKH